MQPLPAQNRKGSTLLASNEPTPCLHMLFTHICGSTNEHTIEASVPEVMLLAGVSCMTFSQNDGRVCSCFASLGMP